MPALSRSQLFPIAVPEALFARAGSSRRTLQCRCNVAASLARSYAVKAKAKKPAARSSYNVDSKPTAKHGHKHTASIKGLSGPTIARTSSYQTYATTLCLKGSPTLLYHASSHAPFFLAAYGVSAFCFAYAGFNFYSNVMYPFYQIDAFPRYALTGACVFMTGAGFFFLMRPQRLIRSLTAIPSSEGLRLQFEIESALPLRKPWTWSVPAESVSISERVFDPLMNDADFKAMADAQWAQQRKLDRTRIWSAPFRHFSYFMWLTFNQMKRMFWREGFVKIYAKDKAGAWKMDTQGGWSSDDGRSIDRLIQART